MARHNLSTVVSFEVTRTLTKRRFWITSMIGPVLLAVIIALVVSSNTATSNRVDSQKNARFTFVYSDASGFVNPTVANAMGGSKAADPAKAIADVKAGRSGAYFEYPSNPAKQTTKVYGADNGIFENGKYSALATELLVASARAKIGNLATLAQGNFPVVATTYKAGQESGGIADVIPPLMFLVIFYLVLVVLGNQMLTSLLEEKENRVTEMILTTLDPTTLVIGKVISLFIIGLVQMVVFAVPVLVGYVFFRTPLGLPLLDLSGLLAHPGSMVIGALLLAGGLILFTATLVAAGAIMHTAKEAGQVFAVLMTTIFVPFYVVSVVVSDPGSFIVQVFTYFPYTAPVTAMLRNGFGSLSVLQSTIVIVELFGLGIVVLRLAVRLFRYGSIEYSKKVSLKAAFGKRE